MDVIEEDQMAYHVAPADAGPRTIWGTRHSNLRHAMEEAEELTKQRGVPHTVWEMKQLWTAEARDGAPVA